MSVNLAKNDVAIETMWDVFAMLTTAVREKVPRLLHFIVIPYICIFILYDYHSMPYVNAHFTILQVNVVYDVYYM